MFYFGPISNTTMLWLAATVLFGMIEAFTLGLTTVWFVIGAVFAAIFSAFGAGFYIQIIVFIIISLILLLQVRPIAIKHFNPERIRTNVDSILGKSGIVIAKIDNSNQVGSVKVDQMEWSARSLVDSKIIDVGQKVNVRSVEGNKLIVEAVQKASEI